MAEQSTPYVNIHQLAEYFGVSISTLRKWIDAEHIPPSSYVKIKGTTRFRVADVEAALHKQATGTGD